MTATFQINNISGLTVESIEQGWARGINETTIAGGRTRATANSTDLPRFTISGWFSGTDATRQAKIQQLSELVNNIGYSPVYLAFSAGYTKSDGWYELAALNLSEGIDSINIQRFSLNVLLKGTKANYIPAQYWTAAAEVTSGFTAPAATTMVSMPTNAADIDFAIAGTATASDGTVQYVDNPTFATLMYTPSATLANWWKGECRAYDSVSAGDTTEANWVQVFGPEHIFAGDAIFQNGLLRYKINTGVGTFYCYDSGAAAAWKTVGVLQMYLGGAFLTTIPRFGILVLSPDEVRWFERRHYGANRVYCEYTLRRGAMYCRAVIEAKSLGIDPVWLSKTGGFAQRFNASENAAAGGGNLTAQASSNYECGYNTTDQIVSGFALCDKPPYQPADTGASADILNSSLAWTTAQTRTIFIISFPANTGTINLTTERAKAAAIAAHCLKSVDQRAEIVPVGFKI